MAAHEEQGHDLKVMTFNINFEFGLMFGSSHVSPMTPMEEELGMRVVNAILAGDADVVFLQETNKGWEDYLRHHLSGRYPVQEWISPDDRGFVAAGSGVLVDTTRATLLRMDEVPTSETVAGCFFNQMVVSLSVSHPGISPPKTLNVVNVHLRPPLGMGREGQGLWANIRAYFISSPQIHRQEIISCHQHVAAYLPPTDAILFLGDFNESASSGGVAHLLHAGYRDALSTCGSTTTWHWPLLGPLQLSGSYDHIVYSPDTLHLVSCRVLREHIAASDHLPVVGTFRFIE